MFFNRIVNDDSSSNADFGDGVPDFHVRALEDDRRECRFVTMMGHCRVPAMIRLENGANVGDVFHKGCP